MKVGELKIKDFAPGQVETILNDLSMPSCFVIEKRIWFIFKKKIIIPIRDIKRNWFTLDHYLFLRGEPEQLDILLKPIICLAIDYFFDSFSDEAIEKMYTFAREVKLIDAYPIARDFWRAYGELTKREEALAYTPEPEEVQAGIDKFKKYGDWGTVNSLAKGMHMKHSEIVKLPYNDCYLMLMFANDEASYQKKYHNILMNKK